MGYSHYHPQVRSFKKSEWIDVVKDIGSILSYVENESNIPLANGEGEHRPVFTNDEIVFNGVGEDGHESLIVTRRKPSLSDAGFQFCKTTRKPYDLAVVACLCYLGTVTETHHVTSDGSGQELLLGLELARRALPHYANILDIPRPVLEADRWCMPWVSHQKGSGFQVHFCVDGHGYVLRTKTKESYRFHSHVDLAKFLMQHKEAEFRNGGRTVFGYYDRFETDIWNAYGSFNENRLKRIAAAQKKVLISLFPVDEEHNHQPPAYVRSHDFVVRGSAYNVHELVEG